MCAEGPWFRARRGTEAKLLHMSEQKLSHEVEGIVVELRDRIVSRHISGEGFQNISAPLKVPQNTVATIIL
jgi:hypothetical protein